MSDEKKVIAMDTKQPAERQNKHIIFTYEGRKYTLMYTKATVQRMEAAGFRFNEVSNQPTTMLPLLFQGAFVAKHPRIRSSLVDEMYETTANLDELNRKLIELASDAIAGLFGGTEEEEATKKASWEANF